MIVLGIWCSSTTHTTEYLLNTSIQKDSLTISCTVKLRSEDELFSSVTFSDLLFLYIFFSCFNGYNNYVLVYCLFDSEDCFVNLFMRNFQLFCIFSCFYLCSIFISKASWSKIIVDLVFFFFFYKEMFCDEAYGIFWRVPVFIKECILNLLGMEHLINILYLFNIIPSRSVFSCWVFFWVNLFRNNREVLKCPSTATTNSLT